MEVNDEPFTPEAASIEIRHAPNGTPAAASSKPADKAVLFLHGFPSSPATYRYAAAVAAAHGFDVFAPRIPTFASDYHLFCKTHFDDWWQFIDQTYQRLRPQYSSFFVAGTSMGGSFALKLAEVYSGDPLRPTAICTLDAPVEMPELRPNWLFKLLSLCFPLLKPSYRYPSSQDMDGLEGWVGYNGIFTRQAYDLVQHLAPIKQALPTVTAPLIAFHCPTDKKVRFSNLKTITDSVGSAVVESRSVDLTGLYGNHHILLLYTQSRDRVIREMIYFFNQQELS